MWHYTIQDPSIALLQSEIKAQERIISGYQDENEKMCAELKDIKVSFKYHSCTRVKVEKFEGRVFNDCGIFDNVTF